MTTSPTRIRWPLLAAVMVILALMLAAAAHRLTVDMDVAASLPAGDRVVADAVHLFRHHPIKDQIAVDIGLGQADGKRLADLAARAEKTLAASGLFARVGFADFQQVLPAIVGRVTDRLPLLFSAADLQNEVLPLLSRQQIARRFDRLTEDLYGLEGIGQARDLSADPLGFGRILLARLAHLAPGGGGGIVDGRLVSADGRHLLIPASPAGSGTDTAFARRLTRLIEDLETELNAADPSAAPVAVTAVGAFRAALDNETIVRRDVNNAIAWATVGIAVLLMTAFARPLVGLLALLPAVAGTVTALLVYSLIDGRISAMVIGFGGAVISISVDHGIAYLLFLDRPEASDGHRAAREIRAVGLLAVLTTVGAFGVLGFSAFPVFAQLGRFTALGIGFAFLFVHTVFARLFVRRPQEAADSPVGSEAARRPLVRLADRLATLGPRGAVAAAAIALFLAGFAEMRLDTDLARMNSISQTTRQAEAMMTRVWGNLFDRVYLMIEADDPAALAQADDELLASLEAETAAGRVAAGVTTATFFPGPDRQAANLEAWRAFWDAGRVAALSRDLSAEAEAHGFVPEAFEPFFQAIGDPQATIESALVPEAIGAFLGRSHDARSGRWRQVTRVVPGARYDAPALFQRLGDRVRIFDPAHFSKRLGQLLSRTFQHMLAVIGVSIVVLLIVFFADPVLAAIALLPLVFGTVCTLGTLGLMGRPLDIATLMLGVVILGLGVDYALLMVSAYQRYQRVDHPLFSQVRAAILMAAASTLIGFAVLAGADHTVLQSAGITASLGIGYCLAGTFLIVPPLLRRRFRQAGIEAPTARQRYSHLEAYPRMLACLRLRLDPVFAERDGLLAAGGRPRTVIDIGCGYGLPASWILERSPEAMVYGIEPNPERARVARMALGKNAVITAAGAPQVPTPPEPAQLALMLDMNHFLDDAALRETLARLHRRLAADGRLLMRSVLPPVRWSPAWWRAKARLARGGQRLFFRSAPQLTAVLQDCRFTIDRAQFSGRRQRRYSTVARPKGAED